MSALVLAISLAIAPSQCTGADDEVPLSLDGDWAADDRAWLTRELGEWVQARDRRLCEAGRNAGDERLLLTLGPSTLSIDFGSKGRRASRVVALTADSAELKRYQLAAATEELVRATWDEPPPRTNALFASAFSHHLGAGPNAFGGGAGFALRPVVPLRFELLLGGGALLASRLAPDAQLQGTMALAMVTASWFPLRAGLFRLGPTARVEAGALWLRVEDPAGTVASGVSPWLASALGLAVGLETRRFFAQVSGHAGVAWLGGTVSQEGAQVLALNGFYAAVVLTSGWLF